MKKVDRLVKGEEVFIGTEIDELKVKGRAQKKQL